MVAKEQAKASADFRLPPMAVGSAQRITLAELIACRVGWDSLHDQMAQGPEQLDVAVAFKTLRVVLFSPGGGFIRQRGKVSPAADIRLAL